MRNMTSEPLERAYERDMTGLKRFKFEHESSGSAGDGIIET